MKSEKEVYLNVGSGRLLNVEVYLDDKLVYQGSGEEEPEDIQNLMYSKIICGSITKYYCKSEYNK